MRRILVNPRRRDFTPMTFTQAIDSDIPYVVDFSVSADDRGTSVSSVSAESKGSRALTITTPSVSSGVATFYVSSTSSGQGVVKVTATYADGKQETQYMTVIANNPEYRSTN
jgi:aspartokinase